MTTLHAVIAIALVGGLGLAYFSLRDRGDGAPRVPVLSEPPPPPPPPPPEDPEIEVDVDVDVTVKKK